MVAIPQRPASTVKAIYDAIESAADREPRGHLGASVIGGACRRALWYAFRWATTPSHDGRMLRLFRRGNLEEAQVVADLRVAGVTVADVGPDGEQFEFGDLGGHVGGSMDGACVGVPEAPKTWHVLEIKTYSTKRFADLVRQGVETYSPQHFAQMQLYMHWSGMTRALYVAVNKNDDQIHVERIRYDREQAERLVEKARVIVTAPGPLEKLDERPEYFACRFCDHSAVCHERQIPPPTCRTCCHATPETDGNRRWSCSLHKRDLSVEQQRAGCDSHAYIPTLMPWQSVNASGPENWIEYDTPAGPVRNGSAPALTSAELYRLQQSGALALAGDPEIAAFRDALGARVA